MNNANTSKPADLPFLPYAAIYALVPVALSALTAATLPMQVSAAAAYPVKGERLEAYRLTFADMAGRPMADRWEVLTLRIPGGEPTVVIAMAGLEVWGTMEEGETARDAVEAALSGAVAGERAWHVDMPSVGEAA